MAEVRAKKAKRGKGKPFEKGKSGNPIGRPKGSRNKLSEDFLSALHSAFERHGVTAIDRMAEKDPSNFVKVIAGLVPKDFNLNVGGSAFDKLWETISAGKVTL